MHNLTHLLLEQNTTDWEICFWKEKWKYFLQLWGLGSWESMWGPSCFTLTANTREQSHSLRLIWATIFIRPWRQSPQDPSPSHRVSPALLLWRLSCQQMVFGRHIPTKAHAYLCTPVYTLYTECVLMQYAWAHTCIWCLGFNSKLPFSISLHIHIGDVNM